MNPSKAQPADRPAQSLFVTLLAWLTMIGSGLMIPISVISLLMLVAGGYGTQTFDPVGFFLVLIAPSLTCVAGFGLLLRWRLARYYLCVLLAAIIVANIHELITGGKSTSIHTSASGVVTTSEQAWGGPNRHSLPIIVFAAAASLLLFLPSVRREFQPVQKSGVSVEPATKPLSAPHAPKPWAVPLVLAVLFGLSLWMGWLVNDGLQHGVVRDVLKGHGSRTPPALATEPERFWFLVGTYSFAGIATAGLGIWIVVVCLRTRVGVTHGQ